MDIEPYSDPEERKEEGERENQKLALEEYTVLNSLVLLLLFKHMASESILANILDR